MKFSKGERVLHRYRVESLVEESAASEVYRVWDSQRAAPLDLVVFHSFSSSDAKRLQDMQAQIKTLANLQHPNILRVFEVYKGGDGFLLVCAQLSGDSLQNKINSGCSPQQILSIMKGLCQGVNYAHTSGVVLGNLNDLNVFVNPGGEAILATFRDPGGLVEVAPVPEYETGKAPTPEGDIYALGCILHSMLTGLEVFDGSRAEPSLAPNEKIKWEHRHMSPLPPSQINPKVPSGLDDVVLKCLAKEPHKRYATPLELLSALWPQLEIMRQESASTLPVSSKPEPQHGKRGFKLAYFVPIMLVVLIGMAWLFIGLSSSEPQNTVTYPLEDTCMVILIPSIEGELHECVSAVSILPSGAMQFDLVWRLNSVSGLNQLTILSDFNNPNLYLTDNLGNRYDHIRTGGQANLDVTLEEREEKQGWFLFPQPDPQASVFIFHDGDNYTQTPPIQKSWP